MPHTRYSLSILMNSMLMHLVFFQNQLFLYLHAGHPVSHIGETDLTRHVIHNQNTVGFPEVLLSNGSEPLLPCCIPHLERN